MNRGFSTKFPLACLVAVLAIGFAVLSTSCDSGGGDGPSGTSTVQGNVSSFNTGTSLFLPALQPRGIDRLLAGLSDLLVPGARAAGMGGVGVHIVGTDLRTTTADDGYFIMSGVPGGEHQMQFTFSGTNAYMMVKVPSDSTVTLHNVTCQGSTASTGHMDVQMHMNGSGSNNMPMMQPN